MTNRSVRRVVKALAADCSGSIWTDDSRLNPHAAASGAKQELAVWIWRPAAPSPSAKTSDYLPPYWCHALVQHEGFILSKFLSRDLTRVQTHSWSDATVSPGQPTYPVIVLRAGGGALSSDYTSIAEDLASHGCIVVSFDAPYRTAITAFVDGRFATRPAGDDFENMPHSAAGHFANQVMNAWIADVKLVLDKLRQLNAGDSTDRFKGKLDMRKLASPDTRFGGATAAQFCHDDARCKAGIDIDGMPLWQRHRGRSSATLVLHHERSQQGVRRRRPQCRKQYRIDL